MSRPVHAGSRRRVDWQPWRLGASGSFRDPVLATNFPTASIANRDRIMLHPNAQLPAVIVAGDIDQLTPGCIEAATAAEAGPVDVDVIAAGLSE